VHGAGPFRTTLNTTTGVGSTCYNGTSNTIPGRPDPAATRSERSGYRWDAAHQLPLRPAGHHDHDGKRSIDAVTVTVAGKSPSYVNGENAAGNALQLAINAASPGDLVIVGPARYARMC